MSIKLVDFIMFWFKLCRPICLINSCSLEVVGCGPRFRLGKNVNSWWVALKVEILVENVPILMSYYFNPNQVQSASSALTL